MKGVQEALAALKASGAPNSNPDLLVGFSEIKDRLGANRFDALGEQFRG
jgi:hypothetical protein